MVPINFASLSFRFRREVVAEAHHQVLHKGEYEQ